METEDVNVKNWKSLIKPTKLDVKSPTDLAIAIFVDPSKDIKILLVTLNPSFSISLISAPLDSRRIILVAHIE